jgi:2-polyprenyl-6-hydroxyphenyl methylase/3-demethylubiquinone-9 3-methyltransferase
MISLPNTASETRFAFGKNWMRYLATVDEKRIQHAMDDLTTMLEVDSLAGKTFLDVGCGSGLSSLAARRLGAVVHSFDYDLDSVACTMALRHRYFPEDEHWMIESGSILDEAYIKSLGTFDIVYSWGVLHHTGHLWEAMANVHLAVKEGGRLFISIYNDQGFYSRAWRAVKRAYCHAPLAIRPLIVLGVGSVLDGRSFLKSCILGHPAQWLRQRWNGTPHRGMNRWHDLVDWVGGYPFEVAKPEDVFGFCRQRGLSLQQMVTAGGGLGCNCFVFQQLPAYRVPVSSAEANAVSFCETTV